MLGQNNENQPNGLSATPSRLVVNSGDEQEEERSSRISRSSPMNFFKAFVPKSFKKKKDRGDETASEETPLNPAEDSYYHQDNSVSDPLLASTPNKPKCSWNRLSEKVQNGEFLLQSAAAGGAAPTETDAETRRQQAQAAIASQMDFSLSQCIIAIMLYMMIAVIAFSFVFDHWSIVDSMYFSVVTFTTIGYGDLSPDSYAGRIFTSIFALSGVACLGIALGVLGNHLIEVHKKAMEQTHDLRKHRVLSLFHSKSQNEGLDTLGEQQQEQQQEQQVQQGESEVIEQSQQRKQLSKLALEFAFIIIVLLLFALLVASDPGIDLEWNLGDALYFAVITASTVGYGDFSPQTQHGRVVAIFFIPLAVGGMGHFLSVVANYIIDGRQAKVRRELETKELSIQDLEIMDEDGDGNVSWAEFLEFMLVAMNKVDKDFIDELRAQFNHLDKDHSGVLSKADLITSARKKLQDPHRKLELASYKRHLLEQSEQARRGHRHRRSGSSWGSQI